MTQVKPRIIKYLGYVVGAAIFGPFALVFADGLLGLGLTKAEGFGNWFMFALTMCGIITFVGLAVSGIRNRRIEWLVLLICGAATYWWGSIFLHGIM